MVKHRVDYTSGIMKNVVEIPLDVYTKLKEDQFFLECLQGVGVDNWNGYYLAQEMIEEGE